MRRTAGRPRASAPPSDRRSSSTTKSASAPRTAKHAAGDCNITTGYTGATPPGHALTRRAARDASPARRAARVASPVRSRAARDASPPRQTARAASSACRASGDASSRCECAVRCGPPAPPLPMPTPALPTADGMAIVAEGPVGGGGEILYTPEFGQAPAPSVLELRTVLQTGNPADLTVESHADGTFVRAARAGTFRIGLVIDQAAGTVLGPQTPLPRVVFALASSLAQPGTSSGTVYTSYPVAVNLCASSSVSVVVTLSAGAYVYATIASFPTVGSDLAVRQNGAITFTAARVGDTPVALPLLHGGPKGTPPPLGANRLPVRKG